MDQIQQQHYWKYYKTMYLPSTTQ